MATHLWSYRRDRNPRRSSRTAHHNCKFYSFFCPTNETTLIQLHLVSNQWFFVVKLLCRKGGFDVTLFVCTSWTRLSEPSIMWVCLSPSAPLVIVAAVSLVTDRELFQRKRGVEFAGSRSVILPLKSVYLPLDARPTNDSINFWTHPPTKTQAELFGSVCFVIGTLIRILQGSSRGTRSVITGKKFSTMVFLLVENDERWLLPSPHP